MKAGTTFPDHRHRDTEEVFVLEGDLRIGSEVLHAGGYCRAEAGTSHRGVSSEMGCLLMVRSSLEDEILPDEYALHESK